jgi:hypothetical protein
VFWIWQLIWIWRNQLGNYTIKLEFVREFIFYEWFIYRPCQPTNVPMLLFIDWNKHLVIFCPKDLFQRKGLLSITKLPILLLWKHILIICTKKVTTYRNGNWKSGQCKPFMTTQGKRGGATWFCNHFIFWNTNSYPKMTRHKRCFSRISCFKSSRLT